MNPDIFIIGLTHSWFLPPNPNFPLHEDLAIPEIDHTPGSDYMWFLESYAQTWETWAGEYSQIRYWEIANETNHDFIRKRGWSQDLANAHKYKFTYQEMAIITLDMTYYASKGIKAANPDAIIILPGMAPVNDGMVTGTMRLFMELLYQGMFEGYRSLVDRPEIRADSPARNPNDYFEALAWHPYSSGREPGTAWIRENKAIYQVAEANGHAGLPVFFTEYGFTDMGNPALDARQGEWLRDSIIAAREQLPFVKAVTVYRMYEQRAYGDAGEAHFGIFTEPRYDENGNINPMDERGFYIGDIKPKGKAIGITEAFGGCFDAIWQFSNALR
jgi:hypothetical protein